MPPKKASPEPPAATPEPEVPAEPPEPVIEKKCFRVGGQVYYGECKAGRGDKTGSYIRHGTGWQVHTAVTPNSKQGNLAHETVVLRTYEGSFEEDLESGHGVAKWADGSTYEGPWSRGLMHGQNGRFVWPDGTTYEGAWHMGQMSGTGGRLDYSDGNFDHGNFYRDCFRDGNQWVSTLGKRWRLETLDIMSGPGREVADPPPPSVWLVGNCSRGGQAVSSQLRTLLDKVDELGVVPFFVGDAALASDPLRVLGQAEVVDAAKHAVSMRTAAITRRRHRNHHGIFGDAMRAALLSGKHFTLVFDDYECGAEDAIYADWYNRLPPTRQPLSDVPEEWGLEQLFFESASGPRRPIVLPPEILQPRLFNGREMGRLFLAEVHEQGQQALSKAPEPSKQEREAATEDGSGRSPTPLPSEAAKQAAKMIGCSHRGVGPTNHVNTLPVEPDEAGVRCVPHLHTALVALAPLPRGLPRDEVSPYMVSRFGHLVPMHRVAIVVLSDEQVDSTPRP